jgi:HEAT repeat protein
MKSLLTYLWQRRWRFFLGAILALVCLPLLHPFVRQALFGPSINGIPWCVFEDAVRYRAHPERAEGSWLQRKLVKAGWIKAPAEPDAQLYKREAIPVLMHLAEDRDPLVRREALRLLEYRQPEGNEHLLPLLHAHLQDSDSYCRLSAATGIWAIANDRDMTKVALPFLNDPDGDVRRRVASLLADMARKGSDLFDPLAKLLDDSDDGTRHYAVLAQRHFGKRGVPVLRKAMSDPNPQIRTAAIRTAADLGKDGAELIPELLALQNDPDRHVRRAAVEALHKMDPERFPTPAKKVGD